MNTQSALGQDVAPDTTLARFATFSGILVGLVFLSNWPTYNYTILGGNIALWYYLLPGLAVLPIISAQPDTAIRFLNHPVFLWFAAYTMSGLAWVLLSQGFLDDANSQWRLRVLALFFFFTIAIVASESKRLVLALTIVACVLLAGALNWFDVLFPLTLVPAGVEGSNPGRGAGMFINANAAGAFVLMGTIVAIPFVPMRFRAALLLAAVVAVAPTFSRFVFVFIVLLVVLSAATKLLDRVQLFWILSAVPLLVIGGGIYYQFLVDSENINLANLLGRLAWFQTLGQEVDFSAEERAYAAAHAWQMFVASPLYGHGIAASTQETQGLGTHNMYLVLMAEQGLMGLILYLALIGIIAYRGWALMRSAANIHAAELGKTMMIYALFLTMYGLASHNVLEEPHGLFVLAFLVAAEINAVLSGEHQGSHWDGENLVDLSDRTRGARPTE